MTHATIALPARILAINSQRQSLMRRIEQREQAKQAAGDLRGRLIAATTKEVRQYTRWERKQRKIAS